MSFAAKPRRTFAIISHPDAGKTTLTEKLLLAGGAIHMAGTVKSRKFFEEWFKKINLTSFQIGRRVIWL